MPVNQFSNAILWKKNERTEGGRCCLIIIKDAYNWKLYVSNSNGASFPYILWHLLISIKSGEAQPD